MGVIYIYVLVCGRKYIKSNLSRSTNICTTVGKKHNAMKKHDLLSETTFLPYFMMAQCVFFYQRVYYFTNGVYHVFHHSNMVL